MKVMLIDDSKTMRNIQKNILTQLGHTELEEACDGQDALDKAAAFQPDLILLDWNMPNMDGLTFAKTYRGQGNKAPIIMVFQTGAPIVSAVRTSSSTASAAATPSPQMMTG